MGQFLCMHETPDAFREALVFTEAETGFGRRLVEKGYYCSLILADFEPLFSTGLVFKGGTCLSKVFAGFFRLSEDLDFAISTPTTESRSGRRKLVAPVKDHLERIAERMSAMEVAEALSGHQESRQYRAILRYASVVTGEHETVKVEVAVREPILEPTVFCAGQTLLRHPLPGEVTGSDLTLCTMSLRETYAEKVRAALTRNPPAIRDLFDIAEAVSAERLNLFDPAFLALVRKKLAVLGNAAIDDSEARRRLLENQLETQLKPVLRSSDYAAFDMQRIFAEIDTLILRIRGEFP